MEMIKELVVLSGKGGTGKTSLTASFAVLADKPVIADCDVDAADLHLVLSPTLQQHHPFISGKTAFIQLEQCISCGLCAAYCRFDAVNTGKLLQDSTAYIIDPTACEGCGVCVRFCPAGAIGFIDRTCGEWMVSETRCGPMVHARLGIASENSGKLVSTVRKQARQLAENNGHSLILIDGPPGIGCPVIASLTGASLALLVTEPTLSGEHDLGRILSLTKHFQIPAAVCVNKWDINPEMTKRIENRAIKQNAHVVGRIRYDRSVTLSQLGQNAVVESDSPVADDIRKVWNKLSLIQNNK